MEAQIEDPALEIKRLQRCMNDLVSLLALPAIWRGSGPSQIVQTLLDVLLTYAQSGFRVCAVERRIWRGPDRNSPRRQGE
jgi:hypothetical protein